MPLADPLFLITSGMLVFIALQAGMLALFGFSRRLFTLFAALCLAVSAYQIVTLFYIQSTDFTVSKYLLHLQTLLMAFMLVLAVAFIAFYTGEKHFLLALAATVALEIVVLLLDYLSSVSVRFYAGEQLVSYQAFWGETFYHIDGEVGASGIFMYSTGLLFFLWCAWRSWVLHTLGDPRTPYFLAYILLQTATIALGVLIDFGLVESFKLLGFGFLGMVLIMAASMALDMRQMLAELGSNRRQLSLERSVSESLKVDQQRLSQVVAQSPHSIHLLDHNGNLLQKNHTADQLWAHSMEKGENLFDLKPWSELKLRALAEKVLQQGEVEQKLFEMGAKHFRSGDRDRWIRVKIFPVIGKNDQRDSVTLICEDVSREQSIESTLKNLASSVSTAGGSDFFEEITRQVYKLTEARCVLVATFNNTVFSTLCVLLEGRVLENFCRSGVGDFLEDIRRGYTVKFNNELSRRFAGDDFLLDHSLDSMLGIPLYDDLGQVLGCLLILDHRSLESRDDIQPIIALIADRIAAEMQRQLAEERIRRMAYEDYITRLPNRVMLHEHLAELVNRCASDKACAHAFFLDLDHFKTINEALGHDIGDDVLRLVGERLREHYNEDMFIARVGGDEFVLVYNAGNTYSRSDRASEIASDIIEVLSKPLELGERIISIGTSVGVIQIPDHASNILDIMRRGDSALFKAKQAGRNCFEIYNPRLQKNIDERLEIERGLRIALEQNQFDIYYQPKVDHRRRVIGAEALMRWQHPVHGFISPALFIPVAEETGLIHLIGEWLMDNIAADLVHWQQGKVPHFGDVAVNISAWQFARSDFNDKTLAAIRLNNIGVERFSIEVTETAILGDIAATRARLAKLRGAGISVMLDDFGTGYSSLAYLKDLPLDGFKIDRAFVDGIGSSQSEALVLSMLSIGKHMNFKVVAEGVETEQQFEKLKSMGCTLFQGYLFARPMPADEFVVWVKENQETLGHG